MDRELTRLVRAIKNGTIQDTDSVRDILRDARKSLDREEKRLTAKEELLSKATAAFIRGWHYDPMKGVA